MAIRAVRAAMRLMLTSKLFIGFVALAISSPGAVVVIFIIWKKERYSFVLLLHAHNGGG